MENQLILTNLLIYTEDVPDSLKDFAGEKIHYLTVHQVPQVAYLIGDISKIVSAISFTEKIFVIEEYATNIPENLSRNLIHQGMVPINLHQLGIFFPKLFDDEFENITSEHTFQDLTESNKPTSAFRKGIYLSPVEEKEDGKHFHLLRCSSNLNGPTDNFHTTDWKIVDQLNTLASYFFEKKITFNHILAQIYHNFYDEENKPKKAKIKSHSDKTKDMPKEALMAFCTFYQNLDKIDGVKKVGYDYQFKHQSVLTSLKFKVKPEALVENPDLVKEFRILLYPGSVFIMSLETNRLYQHEVSPSNLEIEKIPIRMGYVVRCSNTPAIFRDNQTLIEDETGNFQPMTEMTPETMTEIKNLYYEENTTINHVNYGKVMSSMNLGDYLEPLI